MYIKQRVRMVILLFQSPGRYFPNYGVVICRIGSEI